MLANLIGTFRSSGVSRRVTALASAVVVLAALVALTFGVLASVRPQAASAQAPCYGSYNWNGTSCSTAASYNCGASYNPYGVNCSATASDDCNGVDYSHNVSCPATASYNCNQSYNSYNPYGANCSMEASYCYGSSNTSNTACSAAYGSYCNQSYNSYNPYGTNCSTTASSYSCNGAGYSYAVNCFSATGTECTNGTVAYTGQTCPATYASCSNGGQVFGGQQCSPYYSASQGFSVSYAAGWNIVAGPTGSTLTGNTGPLYSFRPGDTGYELAASGSPLTAGVGAWAYFAANTTTTIGIGNPGGMTIQLPAGQFVLIGNSGDTTATVSGADTVFVYNPSTGSYNQTTQLAAGQGAWAISMRGGQATLTNFPA